MTSAGPDTPLLVTVTGNVTLVPPLAMVTPDGTISALRSVPTVCNVMAAPLAGATPLSVTVPVAVSFRCRINPPAPDGPTTVSDCSAAPEGIVGPLHAAPRTHMAMIDARRR